MPRGYYADGTTTKPSFKGRKHTPESKEKMRLAKLGTQFRLGIKHSEESKKLMSEAHRGKHYSPATEFKKGMAAPTKGKKRPDLIGNTNGFKKGLIPWNKGKAEVSTANQLARKTKEARDWRIAVFERDDYTCQLCNVRGGKLNADHIKQFAYFPELRYDVNNGRTLCLDCHRATPTWGAKLKLTEKVA